MISILIMLAVVTYFKASMKSYEDDYSLNEVAQVGEGNQFEEQVPEYVVEPPPAYDE